MRVRRQVILAPVGLGVQPGSSQNSHQGGLGLIEGALIGFSTGRVNIVPEFGL